jgi:hypothetical protein
MGTNRSGDKGQGITLCDNTKRLKILALSGKAKVSGNILI